MHPRAAGTWWLCTYEEFGKLHLWIMSLEGD